jgi:hypothetical protein
MLDMVVHLARLLSRSWSALTGSLSTSTFGLVVQVVAIPLVLTGLTLLAPFLTEGKKALKHLTGTLAVGLVIGLYGNILVYGSVLSWKLIEVTYQDHQALVATIRRLRGELVAKQKPIEEPANSLRRRVIRLADKLDSFAQERNDRMPGFTTTSAMTPEEQQHLMEPQQRYQQQTIDLCKKRFGSQVIGIIQELKAKGLVMTPYDESALSQGMLLLNVTDHLRELAYHLDEKDNVVQIDARYGWSDIAVQTERFLCNFQS